MKRPQMLLVAGPILLAVLSGVVLLSRDKRSVRSAAPVPATLAIEHFAAPDTTPGWDENGFADSLAKALHGLQGLRAEVSRNGRLDSDFILRGTVRSSDSRFIIAIQLMHRSEATPVWTLTYWRTPTEVPALVQEMATGVAEALYANIARRAVAVQKEGS